MENHQTSNDIIIIIIIVHECIHGEKVSDF